jgi:hypothetical protein
MTDKELDQLKKDAQRADYGSRYYKPTVVLELIEEIERLKQELGYSDQQEQPSLLAMMEG